MNCMQRLLWLIWLHDVSTSYTSSNLVLFFTIVNLLSLHWSVTNTIPISYNSNFIAPCLLASATFCSWCINVTTLWMNCILLLFDNAPACTGCLVIYLRYYWQADITTIALFILLIRKLGTVEVLGSYGSHNSTTQIRFETLQISFFLEFTYYVWHWFLWCK